MNEQHPLENLLNKLKEPEAPIKAALIYALSDLNDEGMAIFKKYQPEIPVERRRLLFSRLAEAGEEHFELDLTRIGIEGTNDPDEEVRRQAVEILWFQDEVPIMRLLMKLLMDDPAESVRAKAAVSLGRFVTLGEWEEIDMEVVNEAVDLLIEVHQDESLSLEIRRRALEGMAPSFRKEVFPLIEAAYQSDQHKMKVSAVFAMGQNGHKRWESNLLEMLDSPNSELRFEAVRGAGECDLKKALPHLIKLLDETDVEIRLMAIWALGEIGGKKAQQALFELLDRERDKETRLLIEDALSMASLMDGDFSFYDFPDQPDDDFDFDDDDLEG